MSIDQIKPTEVQAAATLVIVLPSGRQLTLPAKGKTVLGRPDAARSVCPDVDLTSETELKGRISRRHAWIYPQEMQYFIEDLGSTNGTFLNGQRLVPYLPYLLHDADELKLSGVCIHVNVK